MKKFLIPLLFILVVLLYFGCSETGGPGSSSPIIGGTTYFDLYEDYMCYEITTNDNATVNALVANDYSQGSCPSGYVSQGCRYMDDDLSASVTLYYYASDTWTALGINDIAAAIDGFCTTNEGTLVD